MYSSGFEEAERPLLLAFISILEKIESQFHELWVETDFVTPSIRNGFTTCYSISYRVTRHLLLPSRACHPPKAASIERDTSFSFSTISIIPLIPITFSYHTEFVALLALLFNQKSTAAYCCLLSPSFCRSMVFFPNCPAHTAVFPGLRRTRDVRGARGAR